MLLRRIGLASMGVGAMLALTTPIYAQEADKAPPATVIKDQRAAERLRGAEGITLQWISWDWRGRLEVRQPGETIFLKGGQSAADGPVASLNGFPTTGKLSLDGIVTEIGHDYFHFRGTIRITDTPDPGRACVREGEMLFKATGKRRYWRLQSMEACDGLTDYVDIYF